MKLEPETVFQYGDQWFRIAEFGPVENAELIIKANRDNPPVHGGEGAGVSETRVKPLEWREPRAEDKDGKLIIRHSTADGSGYEIREHVGSDRHVEMCMVWRLGNVVCGHQKIGDAKAAAQQHHDAFIRSCLSTATQSAPAKSAMLDLLRYVTGQDEVSAIDTYNEWATDRHGMYGEYTPITVAGSTTQSAPAPGGWREALETARDRIQKADEGLANLYSSLSDDSRRNDIACERIGLQRAAKILDALSAFPAPEPVADAVVERAAREAYLLGRKQWCPAGILKDEARTERDWQRSRAELAALAQPAPAAQPDADKPAAWMDATGRELHRLILPYQKDDMRLSGGKQAERADHYSIPLYKHPPVREDAQPAPAAQEAPSGVVKPMSIYEAVLACPHVIEHEAITLKYDRKQSGHNALSQLAARTRLALADHIADALAERQPQPQEGTPLVNAARELIAARQSTFKARNGRQVGIQDENGEKCWIVPFDEMFALENAVPAAAPLPSQKEGE